VISLKRILEAERSQARAYTLMSDLSSAELKAEEELSRFFSTTQDRYS